MIWSMVSTSTWSTREARSSGSAATTVGCLAQRVGAGPGRRTDPRHALGHDLVVAEHHALGVEPADPAGQLDDGDGRALLDLMRTPSGQARVTSTSLTSASEATREVARSRSTRASCSPTGTSAMARTCASERRSLPTTSTFLTCSVAEKNTSQIEVPTRARMPERDQDVAPRQPASGPLAAHEAATGAPGGALLLVDQLSAPRRFRGRAGRGPPGRRR